MGFTLIAVGFLFFVNPNFNIIDILPDFIGLLLIIAGLSRISLLNEDLKAAKKNAYILAAVDLFKTICIGFLSSNNDPTSYLLFSFTFGVIECILFSSFIKTLFDGIDHIGIRHSSSVILSNRIRKSGRRVELSTKTRTSLIVFYFIRTLLSVLPELTELQLTDEKAMSFGTVTYSQFKGMFYFFAAIIVLAIGNPCIVRTFRFYKGISKEKDFCDRLNSLVNDYLSENRTYFVSRRMKVSFGFYTAAVAALVIPWRDGMPYVPTLFCAVLLLLSVILTGKKCVLCYVSSALLIGASVYGSILRNSYYSKNDIFDAARKEVLEKAFVKASVISLIECVLILVTFISVSVVLIRTVRSHSAFSVTGFSDKTIDRELVIGTVKKKVRKQLTVQKVFIIAFSLIGAVMPFASLYSVKYTRSLGSAARDSIDLPSRLVMAGSVVHVILAVIWLCVTVSFTAFAYNELYSSEY